MHVDRLIETLHNKQRELESDIMEFQEKLRIVKESYRHVNITLTTIHQTTEISTARTVRD